MLGGSAGLGRGMRLRRHRGLVATWTRWRHDWSSCGSQRRTRALHRRLLLLLLGQLLLLLLLRLLLRLLLQ